MTTTTTNKPFVIGMDLGGTNAVLGIVDKQGVIKVKTSIATSNFIDAPSFVSAVSDKIKELVQEVGGIKRIKAVGIGAPNANYYKGTIECAPNISWAKGIVPLVKMFEQALNIPVAMTNDAKAAALGEMTYGVTRNMKDFIMLTFGTGVGSGIVINGKLVYGSDGFAGELGHVIVQREGGRLCGCGRRGCLEAYCSATGVANTARERLALTDIPSLLRDMKAEKITSYDVFCAAEQGDKLAIDIFNFTGKVLGQACADFTTFCSPEAFVLFGGLIKAGDLLISPLRLSYEEHVMPIYRGKTRFLVSAFEGATAAVLGASAIGWDIQ